MSAHSSPPVHIAVRKFVVLCYCPAEFFSEEGTRLDQSGGFGETSVTYTSAARGEYSLWTDAAKETPRGLARLFIEQFPKIVRIGAGSDWPYAGWFVEMLGLAYRSHFPYAFVDWDGLDDPDIGDLYRRSITMGEGDDVRIPLPSPRQSPL